MDSSITAASIVDTVKATLSSLLVEKPEDVIYTKEPSIELKGHRDVVACVAFSPFDGSIVASASWDKTIRIWNTRTQECVKVMTGHSDDVGTLVFSLLDPEIIASGSRDKSVRISNFVTGDLIADLADHTDFVGAVCFSPNDPDLVMSGSHDNAIRVWSIKEQKIRLRLDGHTDWISALCCSPFDGDILASASHDRTIGLWSVETGMCTRMLVGHQLHINTLCFSPTNGDLLLSGGSDNTIRFWSITSGKCSKVLQTVANVNSIDISKLDPDLLVSGESDDSLRVWSLSSGFCQRLLVGHNHSAEFSTSIPRSVVSAGLDGVICIWQWDVPSMVSRGPIMSKFVESKETLEKIKSQVEEITCENEQRIAAAKAFLETMERQAATQATIQKQKLAAAEKECAHQKTLLGVYQKKINENGLTNLSCEDVQELLGQLNISVLLETLQKNKLTGSELSRLSENEMSSILGIQCLGDRRRLAQTLRRISEGQGINSSPIRGSTQAVGALAWDVDNVTEWLSSQGLADICPLAQYHKIDGICLLGLQRDDLECIGIREPAMKSDMLSAIAMLRRQSYRRSSKNMEDIETTDI